MNSDDDNERNDCQKWQTWYVAYLTSYTDIYGVYESQKDKVIFFHENLLGGKKKKSEPKTYSSLKWLSRFHSKLTSFRNFSDSTQPLGLESPNQSTLIPRRRTGVYRKYE